MLGRDGFKLGDKAALPIYQLGGSTAVGGYRGVTIHKGPLRENEFHGSPEAYPGSMLYFIARSGPDDRGVIP
ncbi:hypothetical protein ATOBIA_N09300 [Atopobiaceae bacterium P1]|uniref:Uncharacterized protein n=1 Tax=Leptogranulimonas caecicola TaxID=2894156 RepID=A0AAU9CDU5_9ACTN|nr:hypothetical protein ATOBIA_N09300 [Atopobiaceae bacterium P1]BDC90970.1 hypothetical protein ATTO_08420 [Leptogranulimonas caecicola]